MRLRLGMTILAMALFAAGCTGLGTTPKPIPTPPAEPPAPSGQLPNSVGSYREAMGPGLVLQGHTHLDQVKVEVRVGAAVVQSETVSSKDGGPGYWSLAWPAPAEQNAEVFLIDPTDGKVLASGAISPELFVGLFHSSTFADTRVDAKAASTATLQVAGKLLQGETVRVEFRDAAEKVYSTEKITAKQGAFAAELPWPQESHILHFYTFDGTLGLIINVIAR